VVGIFLRSELAVCRLISRWGRRGVISELPAGTGRVYLRRTAGRAGTGTGTAGTGSRFFFSKSYPTRLIPVPVAGTRVPRVRIRGYSNTQVGSKGRACQTL
jgi:hypothetical protein